MITMNFTHLEGAECLTPIHTRFGSLVVALYDEPTVADKVVGKHYMASELLRLNASGFRLIQLWRSEVEANPCVFEKLVRSAAGLDGAAAIGARSCELDPALEWAEAKAFYAANHPQGASAYLHDSIGLRYNGELVAAMSFSKAADRRGASAKSFDGVGLTRYVTSRRVVGGGGRLLSHWRKNNPGLKVMSYSDPRMFTGKLYQTLGFKLAKVGTPDYLVFNPFARELRHKSAFQRKNLERWRKALGREDIPEYIASTDPRTEFQMEDAMGLLRVYHCGLLRWELEG